MGQILTYTQCRIILNGHESSGWADEDPPWMLDPIDRPMATDQLGVGTGNRYGLAKLDLGRDLTLKLEPSSEDVQWCLQQVRAWYSDIEQGRAPKQYEGSIKYLSQGTSWSLSGGRPQECDPMFYPGQTFTAMYRFDRVIDGTEAGTFTRPSGIVV